MNVLDIWNGRHVRLSRVTVSRFLGEKVIMNLDGKLQHMQVEFLTHKPPPYKVTPETKPEVCLCKTISPVLNFTRLAGFLPITWSHQSDGKCIFRASLPWLLYSIFITCLYTFQVFNSVNFGELTAKKSLPILLNDITDAIYGVYIIILTVTNFARYPKWVMALNEMHEIFRDGMFCTSARKVVIKLQYGFIAIHLAMVVFVIIVLSLLHFSVSFQTNFDYNIIINKVLQNVPLLFYIMFFTMAAVFVGILACFEKLTISCLNYTPVHPLKDIDETNNVRDFFGVIDYQICKGHHRSNAVISKLSSPEIVEHLRILHEDISLSIYQMNACMNPQFLFHTVVELTVLIIYWYAVIAYIAYDFKAPLGKTIHVLNCFFVTVHSVALFLFLKNAQQLKNMVRFSSDGCLFNRQILCD